MKNRGFNSNSPAVEILIMLKNSIPTGLNYKALSHSLLEVHPRISVHNSLRILERRGYITNFGRRKNKIYGISDKGLNRLYKHELRKDLKDIQDYLFIKEGGLD